MYYVYINNYIWKHIMWLSIYMDPEHNLIKYFCLTCPAYSYVLIKHTFTQSIRTYYTHKLKTMNWNKLNHYKYG
jgi:hypothetical protein